MIRKVSIVFLILLSSFGQFSIGQPREKLVYISQRVADLVTVKVPESFKKLNDDQIADKIIASRKPLAMFSSPSGTADFSVSVGNSARNPWEDKDLKLMAEFQKSNIKAIFTSVEFTTDKIEKVNGQNFGIFEFISEVKEKGKPPIRKYNNVRYTIKKKNVLIFSFVCSEAERPLNEPIAEEILKSVKF
jgi:hypothetical protein